MSNKGFIMQGGTVNVGQMAIGDGATVHSHGPAADQAALLSKLDALADAIRAANLPSTRQDALTGVVADLQKEARQPKPDKTALASGLDYLAQIGPAASGIATAVGVVKGMLGLFV